MPKIPSLTDKEVIKLLQSHGFKFRRQKGSHKIFRKENKLIVVPCHGKEIKKGLLVFSSKNINIVKDGPLLFRSVV
jgi:predicted RNA binding protein YcfA (HicA-like mRNA interferase family)